MMTSPSREGAVILLIAVSLPWWCAGANQPPIAEAGPDRYIGASPLTLDGSRSRDPDPGDAVVSWTWSQVSGPALSVSGADTANPTITATPLSNVVANAVLQVVVSDGELESPPDTVQITIVAAVQTSMKLTMENPPFDPQKPTAVFFTGGNCATGGGAWNVGQEWESRANIISFVYGPPYERAADALIAYFSEKAPEYTKPIQTAGFSTGGMPAIDAAIRLNKVFKDPRYNVNIVNLLDGACRNYDNAIQEYLSNPVGDETAWVQNYYSSTAGYATFRARAMNIQMAGAHNLPPNYYYISIYPSFFTTDLYNDGVMAGAATSVLFEGARYRMPNLPNSPYFFKLVFDSEQTGHLEQVNPTAYPGRLPAVALSPDPADGQTVPRSGVMLGCAASENAVAYDLLLGTESGQVTVRASTSELPMLATGYLAPGTRYWWTIQARDSFGTSHRPDLRSFVTPPGPQVDLNADGEVGEADCALIEAAIGVTWGSPGFHLAADYDGNAVIDCRDHLAWLGDDRLWFGDPERPDPCGMAEWPDADRDGVPDVCDVCPRTVPNSPIDPFGCPPQIPGDFDRDGDVDQEDFGHLQVCMTGPYTGRIRPGCENAIMDGDHDIDDLDFERFYGCHRGADTPADPDCGG